MSRSSYSSPYHPSFVVHRDGYGNSEKNGRSFYVVSYIDLIQRKRFIRYLDQLSRKMSCNENEMEDNQKQFLFHLSHELTNEIKRMEDDYKDLI